MSIRRRRLAGVHMRFTSPEPLRSISTIRQIDAAMRKGILLALCLVWAGAAMAAGDDIFIKTPTGTLWGTRRAAKGRHPRSSGLGSYRPRRQRPNHPSRYVQASCEGYWSARDYDLAHRQARRR